ncbi:hypothetical protein QEH59_00575 [Coraliomargarita sp. SDUM461004]|uniref:DUF3604 domain-containing protein n=2 Tax=Thalassobacterium sedimentorum TaxID=3041258 RepID=A0ABU1AE18_9BACT|nr:hypothetical protein [Coraliomargarita sp. SDUM461004]
MSFMLTFGLKDDVAVEWNGSLKLSEGEILEASLLDVWPSESAADFHISGVEMTWTGSSKREKDPSWVQANNKQVPGYKPGVHDYSITKPYIFIVTLKGAGNAQIYIKTQSHGEFSLDANELALGESKKYLAGEVEVAACAPSTEVMEISRTSLPMRYNDFPSVDTDESGAIYTAFVSFVGGTSPLLTPGSIITPRARIQDFSEINDPLVGDQIMLVEERNGQMSVPEPVTENGKDLYGVKIVVSQTGKLWIVWSEQLDGNWDLYLKTRENNKWSDTHRLTTDLNPDIHPVIAADGQGGLHLVWQGFRETNSDILYRHIAPEGSVSAERVVAATDANEWDPAIAVSEQGVLAIAWDTYAKGDYDVYYSLLDGEGLLSDASPVAASRKYEARASVAFDQDGVLWVAYEEAGENWGKDVGDESIITRKATNLHMGGSKIGLMCFKDGKPLQPSTLPEDVIDRDESYVYYYKKFQNPREYAAYTTPKYYLSLPVLSVDENGGVNLIYKKQLLNAVDMSNATVFANYLTRFDGSYWSDPVYLVNSEGHSFQKPEVAKLKNGLVIASGGNLSASRYGDFQNVRISKVAFEGKVSNYRMMHLDEIAVDRPTQEILAEKEDVAAIREFRSQANDSEFRIFRGDTHRHTTFSADGGGDGSILDCMRYGLDVSSLDWLTNGDHDNGYREYSWYMTQKIFDIFKIQDHFVPMFSYERSIGYPKGHRNVLMAHRGFRVLPRYKDAGENQLYEFCREFDAISIPHTTGTRSAGTDWSFNDPVAEPIMEIYQGARNSYEYSGAPRSVDSDSDNPGFYWDALKKGFKMGVISSSDHKSTHSSYAMVYLDDYSRMGIIEALRNRHCYGATDNIILEFKCGDKMMGDCFVAADAVKLDINVRGTDKIKQIDIIKNCQIVKTVHPDEQQEVKFTWEDQDPTNGESHYYVRVMQEDDELAWSSPMWITVE